MFTLPNQYPRNQVGLELLRKVKNFPQAALDTKSTFKQITRGYFYRARMFRHCLTAVQ